MAANEVVSSVIRDAFPDRPVAELCEVGTSWNGANETLGVQFADGDRAFCKVAVDGDGTRIARERAVLRYVAAERSIPVPSVLAADRNGTPPYLVTAPVSGRELTVAWNDADENSAREALLYRVGRTLATLHAELFDAHGEIVGEADAATPAIAIDPAPWPDVLRSTIERTREIGTTERLAGHYDAVVDCVEANRSRLSDAPAALLHGDVAMPNLFVADNAAVDDDTTVDDGIAAIDWELAHVGDPARDLVRAEDQLLNGFDSTGPEAYATALHDGYREVAGGLPPGFAERRPVYEVVRMLGRSGFLDQWATYLDEPIDALADRADAELQARLTAV
ncbi:phosphotransferase family protein [Halorubrum laminariae]|uniref:Phosphotransferase family protein n=1 Tax=Halorubrum laminariae TaxID=1433523 RepID=A0ABD6BV52_9EURY|nr:aminoglycoside phosphotransferase family protein [Halorubrum laminariae]